MEWVASWPDAGDEDPGGAAADGSGSIYVTVSDWTGASTRNVRLARFSAAGVLQAFPAANLADGVTAAAGSHAVALDAGGNLFIAATTGAGDVTVSRYAAANLDTPTWSVPFGSALLNGDGVEHNAIAIASDGHPVVAGGLESAGGVDHWTAKLNEANGATIWSDTFGGDTQDTHWSAVAADPADADTVYAAGDLVSLASNQRETLTRKSKFNGILLEQKWSDQTGDNQPPPDLSSAVAVDPLDLSVVSGGYFGKGTLAAPLRDGLLLKFDAAGTPLFLVRHDGPAGGDDEILDVAVDADGSVYAVGYETVAGQGENLWVRRYSAIGAPVWTRTYHGGTGNDRAVGVALVGGSVVVVGSETVAGLTRNAHVRRYVK